MEEQLIPDLFKTEYSKMVSVLCNHFGYDHIEDAEDIVSDTFLKASQTWGTKGLPPNPTAWLYKVAENQAKDQFRRSKLFSEKIEVHLKKTSPDSFEMNMTEQNIQDSQLKMMFVLANNDLPAESQVGLALRILCGLGINEIASAFLSNKETINKRLHRAKQKLQSIDTKVELDQNLVDNGLNAVLTMIYLLFNEGYFATQNEDKVRKDLCLEALRLSLLLAHHPLSNKPKCNALVALMCFHISRFEARSTSHGDLILYNEQDTSKWNSEMVRKGEEYLNLSASGEKLSRYHLEAAIAYWHTQSDNNPEKWSNILQLYNTLLQMQYSPIAALNRTYALSRAESKEEAIKEALKIDLKSNSLYHALLSELYTEIDFDKATEHLKKSIELTKTKRDKEVLEKKLSQLTQ